MQITGFVRELWAPVGRGACGVQPRELVGGRHGAGAGPPGELRVGARGGGRLPPRRDSHVHRRAEGVLGAATVSSGEAPSFAEI